MLVLALAKRLGEAVDPDVLRALITEIVREELRGALGHKATRNIRRLVRREIRLALDLLEADKEFLERLRYRFPYILEDEAQDSSQLQEHMLRLITAERNWVRVGDPNQAINTSPKSNSLP